MKLIDLIRRKMPPTYTAFMNVTDEIRHSISVQNKKVDELEKKHIELLAEISKKQKGLVSRAENNIEAQNEKIELINIEQNNTLFRIQSSIEEQSKGMDIVENNINSISNSLEGISSLVSDKTNNIEKLIISNIESVQKNVNEINLAVKDSYDSITNTMRREIADQTIFYNAVGERKRYIESFFMLLDKDIDIEELFLNLIRGMDAESVAIISRILKRMQIVLNSEAPKMNILSSDEQKEVRKITQQIKTCILKLSDSLFCYNGYLLPYNYFDLSVFYNRHGLDSINNLNKIKDKDFIDAGAFIGDSALILSEYTEGKVHSFEAVPENYKNVLKTIELNSIKNVVPINMALGESTGRITLNIGENSWCSTIKEDCNNTIIDKIEVDITTLDDYVDENNLEIGLIKVDIEGAEQDFIRGAEKTIYEQKPLLLISIYHNASDFFNIKPMLENLVPEYKFIVHKPLPNVILLETSLIAIPKEMQ